VVVVSYRIPSDADHRPIAIDGAGTIGRQIATAYVAGGSDVRIFDLSEGQRESAGRYVHEHVGHFRTKLSLAGSRIGQVTVCGDLDEAVGGAWMVVEAISEKLELKQATFALLDELADTDSILASNSSSIPTSQMITNVQRPERVLNTHYFMLPDIYAVELMSCGKTDEGVIASLMEKIPQYGLAPFRVRRQSDGFIFNRIWAAIKRECLMVVEEGVGTHEDVDAMWKIFTSPGIPPFRFMDQVGLDVVLDIEEHYASVRSGLPDGPRQLLRKVIDQGRLGAKSGRGFYDDVPVAQA
jgi:3-hydroxybutyryl-CoA dehydrogenase